MDTKVDSVYCVLMGIPRSHQISKHEEIEIIKVNNYSCDIYIEGIYSSYQQAVSKVEAIVQRLNSEENENWKKPWRSLDIYQRNYREIWIEPIKYNSPFKKYGIELEKDGNKVNELKSGKKVYVVVENYYRRLFIDNEVEYIREPNDCYGDRIYRAKGCGDVIGIYTRKISAKKITLERRKEAGEYKNRWKKTGEDEWIYECTRELYIMERYINEV